MTTGHERTRWEDIAAGNVRFPVNETMGFELEPGDAPDEGIAYTWTIPKAYANSEGNLQGGVMAAFIDAILGTVTTPHLPADKYPTLVEMKVSFFRPARVGTRITGAGRVIKRGRRVLFAEAEVTDEDGKLLAKASGTEIPSDVTNR
jgi:uncharacterized protein (TIGR00369 family)